MAISVGSVSVDVVPSTRGFAEQLKAKLKGITANIAVEADTTRLRAQLDDAARTRTATINVNADTAFAEAQIAAVAKDRHANVSVGVSGLSNVLSGVSLLSVAVVGLGPALIPVVAVVAALGAALVAPLALAGGGLTIGGFLAGFAIKGTLKANKQISELAKKVDASRLALSKATTPAGKKSAQLQLAADTQKYQSALEALTPAQRGFLDGLARLKTSFHGLLAGSTGQALFAPIVKGMDLLAKILPSLRPLIVSVSKAVGTLLDGLGKAASGPGFKTFMRSFGREAGSAIVTFGRIFGNVVKGWFNIFRAFGPASKSFTGGLTDSSKAFASWSRNLGKSKSFQAFLAYVKDVGPRVASALGHTFEALGKVAAVLAPLGGVVLELVDGFAKLILAAKPSQIVAVAAALGALAITVAALGGPVVAIPAALLAIGGALVYAYTHSGPFRTVVSKISDVFTGQLLPALKDAAKVVVPALGKAFDNVKQSVHDNQGLFRVLGDLAKLLGKAFVDVVIPAVAQFYKVELPLLGKAIGIAITVVRVLADAFLIMAQFGLEAFRFLVGAALNSFDAILKAADAGLGWIPGIGDQIHDARKAFDGFKDHTLDALDATIQGVKDLRDELNGIRPKVVEVRLKVTTDQLVLNPSLAKPRGIDGAGATGAIVNRPTVALIGEAGPEAVVPLNQTAGNEPLPSGVSGPQFNVEKVVAQDVNDFLRQMQARSRLAGLDAVRR